MCARVNLTLGTCHKLLTGAAHKLMIRQNFRNKLNDSDFKLNLAQLLKVLKIRGHNYN